jgi:UDP-glucose 4-epimerase
MSVAALRFHWIATRAEQLQRAESLRERRGKSDRNWPEELRELWGYVDIRDAARACRFAIEVARDRPYGFQPLNIVAADSLTDESVAEIVAEHAPDIALRAELGPGRGAYAIDRAKELLGWEPIHSWRNEGSTT